MSAELRTAIAANTARLLQVLGKHALIYSEREVADHALFGEVGFKHLGQRYFLVGRKNIAWKGSHHQHTEWTCQLNRFFFVPSLAEAYQETGEEDYATAARDYISDWICAHPTREGWQIAEYDDTLNLAIRILQWLFPLPAFLPSTAFDDAFLTTMLDSIHAQLEYLRAHLTEEGNWRIAQADALLQTGIILDMFPEAADWRQLGVRVLNDAFHRQVLPDGAHSERTPGYHHWMTNLFTRYWALGQAMPELGMAMSTERVTRMHEYSLATLYPNGSENAMHDNNGQLTGDFTPTFFNAYRSFHRAARLPETLPTPTTFFPSAGQIFLRDTWEPDAVYLTFDATTWGGGHCHLSRNAIQLFAYGRALLIDPGTLTYEMSDPMMTHGKSTRAHNTLSLNGWNQSAANPSDTRHDTAPGYDLAQSRYEGGYWPGSYTWGFFTGHGHGLYGEHHRSLLWIHDRCVVVLDSLLRDFGQEMPTLESNWQLAPGPVAVNAQAMRAVTNYDDANLLLLFPLTPPGMTLSTHEGETDPPRGWLPGQGTYTPAPQLVLAGDTTEYAHAQFATILVPFRGKQAPEVRAEASVDPSTGVLTLQLLWGDGGRDEIVATPRLESALNQFGDIYTDAALLHRQYNAAGTMVHGLAYNASYIEPYSPQIREKLGMIQF